MARRLWGLVALLLALCAAGEAMAGASTLNALPIVPTFPFPDSGCAAGSTENLWITQGSHGGNDYRATLNQINPLYIGATAPACPYAYYLWEDTSTTPAVLKQYVSGAWSPLIPSEPLTPEMFGGVGDGWYGQGALLTASSTTVGGITFPASAIGKPAVFYGAGANGAPLSTTITGTTTIADPPSIGNTKFLANYILTQNPGNYAYAPSDVLTMSGGTCSSAPQGTVQWLSSGQISIIVTRPGACTSLPSNPVTFTGGTGSGLTANIEWVSDARYLLGAVSNGAGSGYLTTDNIGIAGTTCSISPVLHPTANGSLAYLNTATPGACSVIPPGNFPYFVAGYVPTGGSGTGGGDLYGWFGSVGDFAYGTDNSTAFHRIAAAVNAAGGGQIVFKPNVVYAINTAAPSAPLSDVLFSFSGSLGNITLNANGARIVDAHHYYTRLIDSENVVTTFTSSLRSLVLNELDAAQAEANYHFGSGQTGGLSLFFVTGAIEEATLRNPRCAQGVGTIGTSNGIIKKLTIDGGYVDACDYGINTQNSGDSVSAPNFTCFRCGRSFFAYGANAYDVGLVSQNSEIADVLIAAPNFEAKSPSSFNLRYTVLPRISGSPSGGAYMSFTLAPGGLTGGTLAGFHVKAFIDERGETAAHQDLQLVKNGVVNAGASIHNFDVDLSIINVQNIAGQKLIDFPSITDTGWSNELCSAVSLRVFTSGSVTPQEHSDLGCFTKDGLNVTGSTVGSWGFANRTAANLSAKNADLAGVMFYTSCTKVGGSALDSSIQAAQPANSTNYWGGAGYSGTTSSQTAVQLPLYPGVLNNLIVEATSPGGGFTDTVSVRTSSSIGPLTCTIADAAVGCVDQTHTFGSTGGDYAWLQVVTPAGGAATQVSWSADYCTP